MPPENPPQPSTTRRQTAVTMQDIATKLGLSVSAVSLALSGRKIIPERTRLRVEAAAAELGYRQNPLVAALMRARRARRAPDSGLVIAYLNLFPEADGWKNSTLPDYFPGCAAEAARLGMRLERFWARDPKLTPRRFSSILRARGIRGVLIGACPTPGLKLDFDWANFCWASLNVAYDGPDLDVINSDHAGITREAMVHGHRLGYRRAGFVFHQVADARLRHAWLGAYLAHARDTNTDGALEPYLRDEWTVPSLRAWLRATKPDLLVGLIDGARIKLLREAGADIPGKIGAISVVAPEHNPAVSGIMENFRFIEIEAVRHLASLIGRNETGAPDVPRYIRIPGRWRDGDTAPPRAGAV